MLVCVALMCYSGLFMRFALQVCDFRLIFQLLPHSTLLKTTNDLQLGQRSVRTCSACSLSRCSRVTCFYLRVTWRTKLHRPSNWVGFPTFSMFHFRLFSLRIRIFFTPFVAEAPLHILLYVVGCCTKGVVELTYEWCHVIIPLLCCNELYSWWTVTPRVSLCQVLLSAHWAWPRASALQVEFGELVYGVYTRGEPMKVP